MTSSPKIVIIATFAGATKAEEVEHSLEALAGRLHALDLGNIAVLEKMPDETVVVHETHDSRAALSRVVATVAGTAAGLVYGFFGWPAPVASEIAFDSTAATVKRVVRDMGFSDTELAILGEELDAGSSALIVVVPTDEAPLVAQELARLGGTVVQNPLTPEVAAELGPDPPLPASPSDGARGPGAT